MRLFPYLLLIAVAGCAGVQIDATQADRTPGSLRTRIEFVDRNQGLLFNPAESPSPGPDIPRAPFAFADPLELSFHAIPGGLIGPTQRFFRIRLKRAHSKLEAGSQGDFAFDLNALTERISPLAAPLPVNPDDLVADPADTRLARLIVSVGDPFYYPFAEREAGFRDPAGPTRYALLFVDRPCRIWGRVQAQDGTYIHDLTFERAGLHWVRLSPPRNNTVMVQAGEPPHPPVVYVVEKGL